MPAGTVRRYRGGTRELFVSWNLRSTNPLLPSIVMIDPVPDTSEGDHSSNFSPSRERLVLVPTPGELARVRGSLVAATSVRLELCGFGPIASAARTASLIALHRPARVFLVGIAGAVGDRLAVGQASEFDSVSCHGIGAGGGSVFQSASELGWKQWSPETGDAIGDRLTLAPAAAAETAWDLVTVCSASASEADVQGYLQRFPAAVAEDMEGFAVAMACRMHGIPLTIVRGISNIAGDRDKSRWRIAAALDAASELLQHVLDRPANGANCG